MLDSSERCSACPDIASFAAFGGCYRDAEVAVVVGVKIVEYEAMVEVRGRHNQGNVAEMVGLEMEPTYLVGHNHKDFLLVEDSRLQEADLAIFLFDPVS